MPVSEKCKLRLSEPPSCFDFRAMRGQVMCLAWKKVEEKKIDFKQAIRQSWEEVRKSCKK